MLKEVSKLVDSISILVGIIFAVIIFMPKYTDAADLRKQKREVAALSAELDKTKDNFSQCKVEVKQLRNNAALVKAKEKR